MATLSWTAAPIGHYANSIAPMGAIDTYYVGNGSYGGVHFAVVFVVVVNAGGARPVTVTKGSGAVATILPNTNTAINIANEYNLTIDNPNGEDTPLIFLDNAHASASLQGYVASSAGAKVSDNLILLHFKNRYDLQSGNDLNLVFEAQGALFIAYNSNVFSGNGKFPNTGFLYNPAGFNVLGLRLALTNPLPIVPDHTIDFWFKCSFGTLGDGLDHVMLGYTNDTNAFKQLLLFKGTAGVNTSLASATIYGVVSGIITILPTSYNHVAIVMYKGVMNLYMNGLRVGLGAPVLGGDTIAKEFFILPGTGVLNPGRYNISEFRVRLGAVWTNNFIPATVPY